MKLEKLMQVVERIGATEKDLQDLLLGHHLLRKKCFPEDDTYYLYSKEGVEFVFPEKTGVLEEINIPVVARLYSTVFFSDTLPFGLSRENRRNDIIAMLGNPISSKGPPERQIEGFDSGGSDLFMLTTPVPLLVRVGYLSSGVFARLQVLTPDYEQ